MNFQHLQYFVALAEHGQYQAAANHCHISQPALSMAIQTLESSLDVPLINRLQKPIQLTEYGRLYYEQAKKILFEYEKMLNLGRQDALPDIELRLGVIPTVAPFLVPRFLEEFMQAHPNIWLKVEEIRTEQIIDKIYKDDLDVGILVTPLEAKSLEFSLLYYEEFYVYSNLHFEKKYVLAEDIDPKGLWILEEGHCMRNQMLQLCELKKKSRPKINYHAGSIETLINLVDQYQGITILPEMSTWGFSGKKKSRLKLFMPPAPVREVSLVFHKYSVQREWIEHLSTSIAGTVPKYMLERDGTGLLAL